MTLHRDLFAPGLRPMLIARSSPALIHDKTVCSVTPKRSVRSFTDKRRSTIGQETKREGQSGSAGVYSRAGAGRSSLASRPSGIRFSRLLARSPTKKPDSRPDRGQLSGFWFSVSYAGPVHRRPYRTAPCRSQKTKPAKRNLYTYVGY